MPQIPSLKSIQAFEVVVRHLSFKDAANDTRISIECVMGTVIVLKH